jgi:transcriptional regulator with PAS, ATPase and Fis domain
MLMKKDANLCDTKSAREDLPVPRSELEQRHHIVAESLSLKQVISDAVRAARSRSTILVTGESGTGKELVARLVHKSSQRKEQPFVVVNCGALPETLLETELFGHEKGSFTGALYRKIGLFETASSGTIFLDEIGEMSPSMQVKLLRVLQEGTFNRIGNAETINVDVRVISATNKDLRDEVKKKKFREDLFYRLNVIHLSIPPLRQRKEDIPHLVEFFVKRLRESLDLKELQISAAAMELIAEYSWPGNVRELENTIERAAVMGSGREINPQDLILQRKEPAGGEDHIQVGKTLQEALDGFKREFIRKTLQLTRGNRKRAAEILDIQRTYLSRLIKDYDLDV